MAGSTCARDANVAAVFDGVWLMDDQTTNRICTIKMLTYYWWTRQRLRLDSEEQEAWTEYRWL